MNDHTVLGYALGGGPTDRKVAASQLQVKRKQNEAVRAEVQAKVKQFHDMIAARKAEIEMQQAKLQAEIAPTREEQSGTGDTNMEWLKTTHSKEPWLNTRGR